MLLITFRFSHGYYTTPERKIITFKAPNFMHTSKIKEQIM